MAARKYSERIDNCREKSEDYERTGISLSTGKIFDQMENFTSISAIIGGLLIGSAAMLTLRTNGRITGISGILSGTMFPKQ
tara:strand:+ start:113 stop:355 length:243 start_codon:yes stop_codon:yes gene_type:complete